MTMGGRMRGPARETRADGQILVIFALSIVTLLGFAGLAIDGGSTFAQQRDQQTASDLAALAAANDFLLTNNETTATTRARAVADANGYTHAGDGTVVDVSVTASAGVSVRVTITALHQNMMAGVLGMPTWTVSTTATALAGFPDTAYGASPFVFSVLAFGDDGTPLYQSPTCLRHETGPNGDAPVVADAFAWTNYGTGPVSTSDVSGIISGHLVIDKALRFGEYIGQDNNGIHGGVFDEVNTDLAERVVPAAVVDANGNFAGWSTFHVISADRTATPKILCGYFVSAFESARLSVTACAANNCPRYLGSYVLKLSD
jgi:Flp pilus assembly protein TadG